MAKGRPGIRLAQEAVALLVALTLNAGMLLWLLRRPDTPSTSWQPDVELWLLPRPLGLQPSEPDLAAPPPRLPSRPPTRTRADATRLTDESEVGPDVNQDLARDDAWLPALVGPPPRSAAAEPFRPDLFRRPANDPLGQASRMPLTLRDSALMGRWAQMQHASLCGDLRAALRKPGNDASQEAILATMARHGCRP